MSNMIQQYEYLISSFLMFGVFMLWCFIYFMFFKGTNCLKKDMWDHPCLIQLWTWFEVSDYRDFWNNERWKLYAKYSKHHYLFHMQNPFQNGANDISEMSKRSKFLCSLDHPILFNICLLVVKMVSKELK